MPTPYESATLNLRLFEMRREPVLREARQWYIRELPWESAEEFDAAVGGPHNAWFRMVVGYWDMAASLVTGGAVDASSFFAAHSECVATFAKLQPHLDRWRGRTRNPDYAKHFETVMQSMPDAQNVLEARRTRMRELAARARETAATRA